MALSVLWDISSRLEVWNLFYVDTGVVPSFLLDKILGQGGSWQNLLSDTLRTFKFLFVLPILSVVFGLTLLLGVWPRLSSLMCWFSLSLLNQANPYVLFSGDALLLLCLLWGAFLPWGRCFAVCQGSPPRAVLSLVTLGFTLQIIFIYIFSISLKSNSEWWEKGYALRGALGYLQLGPGVSVASLLDGETGVFLSRSVYLIQALFPVLVLAPFFQPIPRVVGCILIFAMHLGIFCLMNVGHFPVLGMATAIALLPSFAWRAPNQKIDDLRLKFTTLEYLSDRRNTVRFCLYVAPIVFIVSVFFGNLATTFGCEQQNRWPSTVTRVLGSLSSLAGVDQNWGVFARYNDVEFLPWVETNNPSAAEHFPFGADLPLKIHPFLRHHRMVKYWEAIYRNSRDRKEKMLTVYTSYYCEAVSPRPEWVKVGFAKRNTLSGVIESPDFLLEYQCRAE